MSLKMIRKVKNLERTSSCKLFGKVHKKVEMPAKCQGLDFIAIQHNE